MSPAAVRQLRVQVAGQRQQALGLSRRRLMIGVLLFIASAALLALRLVDLAVLRAGDGNRGGNAAAAEGQRADIIDRKGAALARTFDAYSVAVRPNDVVGDKRTVAAALAKAIPGLTPEKAWLRLTMPGQFRYIERRVLPGDAKRVNAIGEPGISIERERERLYPNIGLAANVLGYTDEKARGVAGIERAFDERLTRADMLKAPLQLSIDSRIQQAMEHELATAMTTFSAVGAAGVVMDIRTGEVLALASLPQINPNEPGTAVLDKDYMNRATMGVYELGSTFKPFTVAMAMESGVVKSFGDMWDCTHDLRIGRFKIGDTHPFHRNASVAEIMMESSNIGTAQIARAVGADTQKAYLNKMGFMEPVSIELKERGRTLTPGANWGETAVMTVGYGHGIAVTPLHLASGYATLFNGGIWRPATILKVGPGHPVAQGRRVFQPETSYRMRALLRLVVERGTGKNADAPGFRVGGKTGTAEKILGGRYTHGAVVTTFSGVFPMDDPRYVVVAMLDEPKATAKTYGFHTAGWNVAPIVSKVITRIGPLLGVRPDMTKDANMSEVLPFVQEEKKGP